MLLAVSEWVSPQGAEVVEHATVRYRTVGDATLTGAVRSDATDRRRHHPRGCGVPHLRAGCDPR